MNPVLYRNWPLLLFGEWFVARLCLVDAHRLAVPVDANGRRTQSLARCIRCGETVYVEAGRTIHTSHIV